MVHWFLLRSGYKFYIATGTAVSLVFTRKCHLTNSHVTKLCESIFTSLKIFHRRHGWQSSLWSAMTMVERNNLGCSAINTELIYLSILLGGRHEGTYRPLIQDRGKGLKFWSRPYQLLHYHSCFWERMCSVVLFVGKATTRILPFFINNIIS